jgi:hypothetical protein
MKRWLEYLKDGLARQAPEDRIACELARSIPAFQLRVNMNGRFWEEMERILF